MADKELACAECKALHDFEMGPDTGTCLLCGGDLIEDESERGLVGAHAVQNAIAEAVDEANQALHHAGVTTARIGLGRGKKLLS